ncbi:MAG: LytR C-terminal domain-containing protein [Nocardioides sp.]
MTRAARSGITLAVLCVILFVGLAWGWKALTSPFPPSAAETSSCSEVEIAKGDKISRSDVTVSVLNASGESGLAGQVMEQLVALGFAEGEIANVDAEVVHAQIWTDSPATPLVQRNLVEVYLEPTPNEYPGIVLVLGTQFDGISKGPTSVTAKSAGTICSPTV